jgi:hypothetical protein
VRGVGRFVCGAVRCGAVRCGMVWRGGAEGATQTGFRVPPPRRILAARRNPRVPRPSPQRWLASTHPSPSAPSPCPCRCPAPGSLGPALPGIMPRRTYLDPRRALPSLPPRPAAPRPLDRSRVKRSLPGIVRPRFSTAAYGASTDKGAGASAGEYRSPALRPAALPPYRLTNARGAERRGRGSWDARPVSTGPRSPRNTCAVFPKTALAILIY